MKLHKYLPRRLPLLKKKRKRKKKKKEGSIMAHELKIYQLCKSTAIYITAAPVGRIAQANIAAIAKLHFLN